MYEALGVFMIGCGVRATIEQWTPQNLNRYNSPPPLQQGNSLEKGQ